MALWSPECWPLAASSPAVPKTEQEYAEQLLLSARSAATQSTDSSVGALVPRLRSLRAALGSNDDGWSAAGTPRQLVDAFSARIASALRDPIPLPAAAEEPDEEAPPTDGGLSSRRQALLLPHIARQLVGQVVSISERMEARRLATESCKDACAAYRGSMLRATSRMVHPSEGPSVGERLRTCEQTALEAALDAVGANHRAAAAPRGAGAAVAGAAAARAAAGPAAADSSQPLEAALCAQAAVAVRRALGPTIRAQVRASLARRAALLSDGTARERAGVVAVRLAMHELEQQAAEAVGEVVARTLERARATTTRALQQAQAEAEALATDRAGWRLKLLREPVPLAPPHSSAPGGGAAAAAAPPPLTAAAAATGESAAGAAEEAARRQLSRRRDELQLHVDEYGRAYEEEFGAPRTRTHTHTHTQHTHAPCTPLHPPTEQRGSPRLVAASRYMGITPARRATAPRGAAALRRAHGGGGSTAERCAAAEPPAADAATATAWTAAAGRLAAAQWPETRRRRRRGRARARRGASRGAEAALAEQRAARRAARRAA